MLDMKSAKLIRDAINKYFDNKVIDLENVCRMQPIQVNTNGGYTILGIQRGDLTILVWVRFGEISGLNVLGVKALEW